jgi:hypothetical protein
MAKPGAQDPCNRAQGNTTPRLAEVREVSVDIIGGEAFERIALLSQIEEELPDVPVLFVTRRQCQPTFLALYLKKIFNQRVIRTCRRIWIVGQTAQPVQKAAINRVELLLGPVRSGGSSLCHALHCPRSGDGLQVGSIEAMISRPPLDLPGDA